MLIEMLMEIDLFSGGKEAESMIQTICDDTLGGFHAIDAHKFAREFVRRRRLADTDGHGEWQSVEGTGKKVGDRVVSGKGKFESNNKFVVVGKKKKR